MTSNLFSFPFVADALGGIAMRVLPREIMKISLVFSPMSFMSIVLDLTFMSIFWGLFFCVYGIS